MSRLQRLTDFIARLLGKEWDMRALEHQRRIQRSRPQASSTAPGGAGPRGGAEEPGAESAAEASADSPAPARSSDPARSTSAQTSDTSRSPAGRSGRSDGLASEEHDVAGSAHGAERPSLSPVAPMNGDKTNETIETLTLARVEAMLTGPMDYNVQLAEDREHPCLLGTWDSFPFVIEIPEGHDGWLLVSGDWEEAAPASQRDEIAASVNDWNRDKFFPTVGVVDTPIGPLVRATYLTDMSSGVTDAQLRLHLDTALSACTQALSLVGPLLPEICAP